MTSIDFFGSFNVDFFKNRKFVIDERKYVNADFFIKDLLQALDNPSIYFFNNQPKLYNSNYTLHSEYNGDIYKNETILDHAFIARKLFNINLDSQFCIFRDGTCTKQDWYDFDIVIIIELLPSGISTEYDGIITVKNREKVFFRCKYKSYTDKTEYFKL
ncbi:hypothetical protein NCER_101208 [Vairimorpha ceranae BRL01]|uniref:Uncharacterized protein n=2 Tax=Vairimorpha ceranae TaxID=40302 RepID=C4V9G8_VAIC1|nr:hypothetical protein AAJ76_800076756 [Vairimorpha ceranae]EEQ82132.1 hypothetical protein NCER_101208 [Vairimorpha ceranae BRL01]KAF5140687.1 hypothetical protein G9O61_00g011830 [Vairimorpha ceranae]KKO76017.1 hypothetical protein AAJ76_800076756 [Vairimorpha ceranae]